MKRHWATALTLILTLASGHRASGAQPDARLPLDKLLETPISTAAKYDQQLAGVAASVTVITAEEIERYGWSTLDEVLQGARSFYTTYDRSYVYAGVRGIGRPTDYNNRLLVLIDGIPLNDNVFGSVPIGGELALDISTVEKIEIVRGPGSAVYGSHAMFAVVNIITKNADAMDGVSISAIRGSHHQQGATLRGGAVLRDGLHLTGTAYWQQTDGADLFFPEYGAVARRLDYEDLYSLGAGLQKGNFRIDASARSRTKGLPTAMYDTQFGADSSMTNRRTLVSTSYSRAFGANKSVELRGYWDRSSYRGAWPYDNVGIDSYVSTRINGEARFQWDIRPNHRITAGTEIGRTPQNDYWYAVDDFKIDLDRKNDITAYYLQYEGHPSPLFGFVAGIRRDDFRATADGTSPRAALLLTPNRGTTLKLLYGRAFRSPNIYEAYYEDALTPWKAHPDLRTESVRTTELVWEQRLAPELFLISSVFHTHVGGLIDQELDPASQIYWYDNAAAIDSNGAELSLQMRRQNGVWAAFSGTFARATEGSSALDNSPRALLKAHLSTSPWQPFHYGVEAIWESSRQTRDGDKTPSFALVNLMLSRQLAKHFDLTLTARNLLAVKYSNPVGPELRPQSIRQDGRSLTLKLTYSH